MTFWPLSIRERATLGGQFMARVTVEDCLQHVRNRFLLVHAAIKRTKMFFKGAQPLLECKNREIVTALREIAENKVWIAEAEEEKKKRKRN